MAARITRAKKKIAAARVPFRVPGPAEMPERLDAVLTVVHLVLTTGHTVPDGDELVRRDLLDRALDLARMLRARFPADPAVAGLLALVLLTDARSARPGRPGRRAGAARRPGPLPLGRGDDRRGDGAGPGGDARAARSPATPCSRPSRRCTTRRRRSPRPTGRRSSGSTTCCWRRWPNPVVALNRAAAVGFADGPAAGLAALEPLAADPRLATYHYLAAARGAFLRRLGRDDEAALAEREAALLPGNAVEREALRAGE